MPYCFLGNLPYKNDMMHDGGMNGDGCHRFLLPSFSLESAKGTSLPCRRSKYASVALFRIALRTK